MGLRFFLNFSSFICGEIYFAIGLAIDNEPIILL